MVSSSSSSSLDFWTPALFKLYLFFLLQMLYEFRMQRVEMGIRWMVSSSSPQDPLTLQFVSVMLVLSLAGFMA